MIKKAVGYTRTSTAHQADGHSIEVQAAKIEAWAVANGYELLGIYSDAGISGSSTKKRVELAKALDVATGEGAAVVVYSLSRLARSTRDMITISDRLEKAGADLVSLSEAIDTTSAAGRMVFKMLAVLSEFERDLASERVKATMQHMKKEGKFCGGQTPFGFHLKCGELVEHKKEQRTIRAAKELYRDNKSLSETARELTRLGYKTRTGKSFHAMQVSRIVNAQ